ncbi:MAG: DUF5666 domain-containing protein [Candidatus Omnitrophica bacterium]|nr:DUF5666 domain-containing protein [Candidatus Omnitrophota bacterium]
MKKLIFIISMLFLVSSMVGGFSFGQDEAKTSDLGTEQTAAVAEQPEEVVSPAPEVAAPAQEAEMVQPAPEVAEPVKPKGEPLYAYGKVTEVAPNSITISEYDFDTEQETKTVYTVDEKTELENITAVANLKAGDEIDIEYLEENGTKKATYIYLYTVTNYDDTE